MKMDVQWHQIALPPLEELLKATKNADEAYVNWEKTFTAYMKLPKKPSIREYFREHKCYVYSNDKLIKLLKIQPEEMHELKTIINTKEKNIRSRVYRNTWLKAYRKKQRRNKNGLTLREQAKVDKIEKIEMLINKGFKQIEIINKLGISKSLVAQYTKEINQNKLKIETNAKKLEEIGINEMFENGTMTEVEAMII